MNDVEKKSDNELHVKSWEIEVLISGGAFFSLYQLRSSLSVTLDKITNFENSNPLIWGLGSLKVGIGMLSIYFAIHLCSRAFWLSLILLQKIYPHGINVERLKLAEPFKSITNRFDLSQRIIDIDKLSGLIFAWAITFVVIFVGLGISYSVGFIPLTIVVEYSPHLLKEKGWVIITIILMLSLSFFLIDVFSYGILRRSKFLSKIFYPIYLFWNTVSLGFLWRPNLQVIFSNVKSKWKASIFVIAVTVIVRFMTEDENYYLKKIDSRKHQTEKIMGSEVRYLDKLNPEDWKGSFIQSDVITDDYLKIYIVYNMDDDEIIDSLKTKEKYFSQLIRLSINDSVYTNQEWVGMDRINGQKGIQTVLDISHLRKKMHVLKIERTYNKQSTAVIPFWKM